MKRVIALAPAALVSLALLACTQQHSTAPTASATDTAPANQAKATSGDTNTFGESRDQAAGNASAARDASMSGSGTAPDANSTGSAPPK